MRHITLGVRVECEDNLTTDELMRRVTNAMLGEGNKDGEVAECEVYVEQDVAAV